ncbi:MAG: AAA family ATPase [Cyanobacteria bacterium P01_H01_bin.35]
MLKSPLCLPGYQQTNQIYAGNRTLVYRGIRESDRRRVAIKVLRNPFPRFNDLVRFRNQYVITRHLEHPAIVRPLALERYGNGYALVMPDQGAVPLSNYWPNSSQTLKEFLILAIKLADALQYLTQQRIIHKDIKPSNILIHPETKQVQLIDFSISSLLPKEQQQLINPNVLEGTLAYISPEQTGRMNRGLDYRTDFYSLGMTFFQLLTGQLPFATRDPMELVHCHIAQKVKFPESSEQGYVPEVLQGIVLKLMAKNGEERYQSALGLKHDFERCLQQLETARELIPFELGERDLCDRFLIPEKLYGRDEEVQILLDAFERVAEGNREMMLVAGFSGIGKTAVVNEVHKPIVKQRGYFIKGKFDQFNRNIPFSGFVQAFRDLMSQLLSESDADLSTWKAKILEVVGENGQVLIDVIPELERIIGQQPPVPELSGNAAQNRFNLLFGKFVRVFTTKEHPLVMFLDDLQWVDSASLKLLKFLMEESETGYLLVLGAYRDNEVFPAHPLMLTLAEIEKQGAKLNNLILDPLGERDITRLVADTLVCSEELATPLAQLVYQKTKGNPFFATQFLQGLHKDGYIAFIPPQSPLGKGVSQGGWQCDLTQVRQLSLTEDVVEFVVGRLRKLPEATQEVLKLAACIGNQFDLETLAVVCEQTPEQVATDLWGGLQEGFVLPESEIYKFFQEFDDADLKRDDYQEKGVGEARVSYRFLHDRVQQAAYSLIPEAQKQTTHLKIGYLLLQKTPEEAQEEKIFEIVNQLNYGVDLLTTQVERDRLAQLNLTAGRKALASTAYRAAVEYFSIGRNLIESNAWQQQYRLCLELHTSAAEAAYLNGDLTGMEQLVERVLQQAKSVFDQIKVYEIQMQAYASQTQFIASLQVALQGLQCLEVYFPNAPTPSDIETAFVKVMAQFQTKTIAELTDLPLMQDQTAHAILRLLAGANASAFQAAPYLFPLIVFKMVSISIEYGNSPESALGYALYGTLLIVMLGDWNTGYQLGQLALNLLEKFNDKQIECKIMFVVNCTLKCRQEHLSQTIQSLQEAYQIGFENGDIEFAGYSLLHHCDHCFFTGYPLADLEQKFSVSTLSLEKIREFTSSNILRIYHQAIVNLTQGSEAPGYLIGNIYNELQDVPRLQAAQNQKGLFYLYFTKLLLHYLFQDGEQAIQTIEILENYLDGGKPNAVFPILNLYDSLTHLMMSAKVRETEREKFLKRVSLNQEQMNQWATYAPMNYQHKWHLVEAERHRFLGKRFEAMEFYDRAITGAKENGYLHEESLANELAARFYLEWGKEKVAVGYMQEAYYGYARWGAKAKTDDLEKHYPHLLQPIIQQAALTLYPLETLAEVVGSNLSLPNSSKSRYYSSSSNNTVFDFAAIIKASQSLSDIIRLEELLHQLTQIILQNLGGDRCALILPDREGNWQVEAIATPKTTELSSEPLEGNANLPIKLIQYVKNTQEVVVIDDLKTDLPVLDEYLIEQHPQSILCLPLLNQGSLIGILYLRNQSTRGVFNSDRLVIVKFLCTQAAISLENARLYAIEQEKNQQLQLSEFRLKQLFEKAADAVLLWGDRGVIDCNQAAVDLFRCSTRTELYSVHFAQISPEFQPDGQRTQEKANATIQNALEHGSYHFEWVYQRCDGEPFWAEVVLTAIPYQEETILHSLIRDISQRKEAQSQLIASEQRYATLATAVPVGIFRTDAGGACIYVNERWCHIAGLSPEAAVGEGWLQGLHPDDQAKIAVEWQKFIQENHPFRLEFRFQDADGAITWVYGQSVAERNAQGEICGYVGSITDISHRKQAETEREKFLSQLAHLNQELEQANHQLTDYSQTLEQKVEARTADLKAAQEQIIAQEKLASLGTLTAGVAHELRNPLNFVQNYAEGSIELTQDLLDELQSVIQALEPETSAYILELITDLQENATTINQQSQRATQIIESMMQHTHVGYKQAEPQLTHLHELLDQVVKLVHYNQQAQKRDFNLSIRTDYDPNLESIEVIPSSLMRALINLIGNACDAMRFKQSQLQADSSQRVTDYTPTLSISTRRLEAEVEIRLRDNGCGINPEIQSKVLVPFFTTKPPGEGTGLGLSLTHDIIVKQHQGTLTLDSQLDEFTEIILRLPWR